MFYQKDNLAVAQIPKSGLRTMSHWLGPGTEVVENDRIIAAVRVAFIRNPLERLKSYFSMKHYNALLRGDDPVIWEPFVDELLSGVDNEHWRLQTEHIKGATDVIFHRLENIGKHYFKYKPGPLDRLGICTRMPTNDYRYDELVEFYRADQRLWDNIT